MELETRLLEARALRIDDPLGSELYEGAVGLVHMAHEPCPEEVLDKRSADSNCNPSPTKIPLASATSLMIGKASYATITGSLGSGGVSLHTKSVDPKLAKRLDGDTHIESML